MIYGPGVLLGIELGWESMSQRLFNGWRSGIARDYGDGDGDSHSYLFQDKRTISEQFI